jgi:hypothetical protein
MLNPNEQPRRPAFVWVISGLIVLAVLGTNLYLLLYLAGIGGNPEFAASLEAMTIVDYARRLVFGVLELAAAISLFLLRNLAVQLFLGLLVLFIVFILYSLATGALTPQDFLTTAAGGLIAFGLPLWYSLRLQKGGVLR